MPYKADSCYFKNMIVGAQQPNNYYIFTIVLYVLTISLLFTKCDYKQ